MQLFANFLNLFYEKDKFIFARAFHFSPIDMYIHIYINDKIYLFIFFFFIPRKIFSFVIRNQFLLTRTIAHLFFLQRTNKFSIRIREKKKKKNNNTQSSLHNPHKGGLIRNTSHARSLIPRVHISIYIYIYTQLQHVNNCILLCQPAILFLLQSCPRNKS